MMPTGRVKYYNSDKGYGFIAQDTGEKDVFLHISAIQDGYDEIYVGQYVRYEVAVGDRGPVAQNVKVLLTPLEKKRLRQGKAVIPRNYTSPQQPNGNSEEKSFTPSRKPVQPTPVTSPIPQGSKQKADFSVETAGFEPTEKSPPRTSQSKPALTPDEQPTFGDLYIQKQIHLQTPMLFGLYNHTLLPATVTGSPNTTSFYKLLRIPFLSGAKPKDKNCRKPMSSTVTKRRMLRIYSRLSAITRKSGNRTSNP